MVDVKLALKGIWRFHSGGGKDFTVEMDRWTCDNLMVHTTSPGYHSQANGISERAIQEVTQGIRSLCSEDVVGTSGEALLQHCESDADADAGWQTGHPVARRKAEGVPGGDRLVRRRRSVEVAAVGMQSRSSCSAGISSLCLACSLGTTPS